MNLPADVLQVDTRFGSPAGDGGAFFMSAFSGEIDSCNPLIVEGTMQAKLDNFQHMIINESGVFRDDSSIHNADVHGFLEGNLVVRKRLLIRATGRVSGTIMYGEIEIERGRKIFRAQYRPTETARSPVRTSRRDKSTRDGWAPPQIGKSSRLCRHCREKSRWTE